MRSLLPAALLLAALAPAAHAEVKLPAVFGSHMVLQRDKPVVVWGWAEAGEKVTVTLGDAKADATADGDGAWRVKLPAMKANAKGQTLTAEGKNKVTLDDVLIGEVWLGSGQSNMEWSLAASGNPKETIAAANHPTIRLFQVPKVQSKTPNKDVKAKWAVCTPASATNFSAVLYHFGVKIQKELDVPVGLVNSSWGGSPIEPWLVGEKAPGQMYNAMIAPLAPLSMRGLLWYQGESNMAIGMAYRDKKEALIKGWRKAFEQELPFYFVQIAPWSKYGTPKLPELWEAQCACLKIPGTGMAVTTDLVDDINDIHPKNKTDVGHRLARWALARTYGKKGIVVSGPLFKSLKIDGGKAVVSFAHTAGGLKSRDGKALSEWEIAGEDGKFVPAGATIEGETVVVESKDVKTPTQVRFGWRNVANPNLANKEGLPASPFRSKDWKGGTGESGGREPE